MEKAIGPAIASSKAGVVGISVQYRDQMLLALIAAKIAKKINPDCFVVMGGPRITSQVAEIRKPGPVTNFVDGLMIHEAETGLRQLIDALSKGSSLERLANLYYKDGDSYEESKNVEFQMPVSEYTIPDFSGFDLSDYGYGLPIRTLRGC